jgi:hypothetical protein
MKDIERKPLIRPIGEQLDQRARSPATAPDGLPGICRRGARGRGGGGGGGFRGGGGAVVSRAPEPVVVLPEEAASIGPA